MKNVVIAPKSCFTNNNNNKQNFICKPHTKAIYEELKCNFNTHGYENIISNSQHTKKYFVSSEKLLYT